jgi:hypothetical protein
VSNFIYEWIILIDERQPNSKISVADWLEEAKSSTTIVDLEKKKI